MAAKTWHARAAYARKCVDVCTLAEMEAKCCEKKWKKRGLRFDKLTIWCKLTLIKDEQTRKSGNMPITYRF